MSTAMPPSDVDRPLLADEASPPQTPTMGVGLLPARRITRRWLRPLIILLLPTVFIMAYSVLHPQFPDHLPHLEWHNHNSPSKQPSMTDAAEKLTFDPSPRSCVCGATERGQQLCEVFREEGLEKSRLVQGTGARTRRLMVRAREGKPIKIGILGGSVSACRGVHPSPDYPKGDPVGPGCYTSILKRWMQDTFTQASVTLINGAIGGSDSGYYSFCGTHHIPEDVDLVVVEFDVNDQAQPIYQHFYDQLLRVLLEMKSQPAVVILGAWAPQVAIDQGYNDPQIPHVPIAMYYDVPYISLKRVIFDHYSRFPSSTAKAFWQPDILHPNLRGHRLLGDLLIAYFEHELCLLNRYGLPVVPSIDDTIATQKDASTMVGVDLTLPQFQADWVEPPDGWEQTFDSDMLEKLGREKRLFALRQTPYDVPFVTMFTPLRDVVEPKKPDPRTASHLLDRVQPDLYCADANSKQHPMKPVDHENWEPYAWQGEKHYWVSSTPGARIRLNIQVSAGRVAVYYFRSKQYDLGDARCWVDDNEDGATLLPGYWNKEYNMAFVKYIDQEVTKGSHYVTCEIANTTSHPTNPNAHHFRIVAIMAT